MFDLVRASLLALSVVLSDAQAGWLGAYQYKDGIPAVHRIMFSQERNQEHVFLDAVGAAVHEAKKSEMADPRFGYINSKKPRFPAACAISHADTLGDSPPCAYLFAQKGATYGPFLALAPNTSQNDCFNLVDDKTYSDRGHDIKTFQRDYKGKNEIAIESLRLQGNVAVEFFENTDCSPSRNVTVVDFDSQANKFNFTSGSVPAQTWRFSATKADGYNFADYLVRSFEDPLYKEKEPACLCPDVKGQYPPLEDFYFLNFWNKLEASQYISSSITDSSGNPLPPLNDAQKVGMVKFLMNFQYYEEDRLMALENLLGPLFKQAKAIGNTDAMADIKRQLYDMIFVDGPINFEMPFPFGCSGRFTPRQVGPRSMRIVTNFEARQYSEAMCGTVMARTSLQARKEIQMSQSAMNGNEMSTVDAAALNFGTEASPAQIAMSPACVDSEICAEFSAGRSAADCEKTFKELGAQKAEFMGFKVKQICKKMCGCK